MNRKIKIALKVKTTSIFISLIFMCLASCSRTEAQEIRYFLAKDEAGTPYDYIDPTQTEHFLLAGDESNKTMTCFEDSMDENYNRIFIEKWKIPRYWPNERLLVQVSNNGEFCVLDNKDEYTEKTFEKKDILFWVYKNGKLYDTITRGKYLKELKKILDPDIKLSDKLEVCDIEVFINGLKLDTFYFDSESDDAIYEIFLWYDFDTKKFLNATQLRADQCKIAFDVLAKKFSDAEKLIEDNDDKAKFRRAFEKIMPFEKDAPTDTRFRWRVRTYEDGDVTVYSVLPSEDFRGMKALERFQYKEGETVIDFFILDDVYDFAIRIPNGGKFSQELNLSEEELANLLVPDLVYMFETKKGIVKTDGK